MQTKLLGQKLYYILTTGSGQQTLGEEYCDITQVLYLKRNELVVEFFLLGYASEFVIFSILHLIYSLIVAMVFY